MVAIERGQREGSAQAELEQHQGMEEEEEEEDAPTERCPQLTAAEPVLVLVTH